MGIEPIKKVLKGTHAVLASRQQIEMSITKQEKEKIFISNDILFTKFQFIQMNLVKVNYAAKIANAVNLIEQSGLSQKVHRNMREEKTRSEVFYNDNAIDTDNEKLLKMYDIISLLYLLVTGYLISFVVFFTEIFVNKIKMITSRKGRMNCYMKRFGKIPLGISIGGFFYIKEDFFIK
ncbi:uncharacterized protein LOC111639169, partial [Centruroides sculpturatus]|uniref:uncharacterized protein LOC111639169 n=1 Tax=Centruroides sculpturatus TaxID=218467 RepID=UPI000C6DAFBB